MGARTMRTKTLSVGGLSAMNIMAGRFIDAYMVLHAVRLSGVSLFVVVKVGD